MVDALRDGPKFAIDDQAASARCWARIVENTLVDRARYLRRARRDPRDWDGITYADLGARLGLSEEAARKRYQRALPRLAEKLDLLRRGCVLDALPAN